MHPRIGGLNFVLFLVFVFHNKTPMKPLKKRDLQNAGQGKTPPEHPKNEGPEAHGNPPIIPEVVPTPEGYTKSKSCKPDQTPSWKSVIELGVFCLGVYAVIVYRGQWDAALAANQINARNFQMGQRAWVGLDTIKSSVKPLQPNLPIEWSLLFHNYGMSAALHLRWHVRTYVMPANGAFGPVQSDIRNLPILMADAPEFTMFNGQELPNNGKSTKNPTAEEVGQVNGRTGLLIFGGKALYFDIFKQPHFYTFCRIYNPPDLSNPPGLLTCPFGDETDPQSEL